MQEASDRMQEASDRMQEARGKRARWEWPVVIGLLLIAFFFRIWMLNDVPPGLHHDEVIIGQVAQDILRGHFGVYFTAGYGHEPLYHYLVAGMFGAVGANAFVLRLTSAFIAMLGLAATYVFVRRIFSPTVAVGTLAWMAISLWPVFFARVGLRGITLPLLTTLTAYFLWRALSLRGAYSAGRAPTSRTERERNEVKSKSATKQSHWQASEIASPTALAMTVHPSSFLLPGVLLGLSLYTYQASRVFPLVFGLFLLFVFVQRRRVLRTTHHALRNTFIFFLAALMVAAPLILYLTVINPTAEARVADLSGPLNQLRAGNPGEVISSTLNTLGMFTYRGDAVPIYNVGGRPVFPEIFGAVLFVFGLLICLWRWKRPAYALLLIWFFISLIPAMVTPFSPNFVRTIAAWPAPFVFVGLAMVEVARWVAARSKLQDAGILHSAFRIPHWITALFALVLVWNAALTANDYFRHWPTSDYVRFWQQATWTQAVRALNADPSRAPIAASGLSIHDFDPQTFDLLGLRPDLKVKWFDCRNAILYPVDMEQPTIRYLSPPFFSCDADLKSSYLPGLETIEQPQWPDSSDTIFSLEQFKRPWTLAELLLPRVVTSTLYLGAESFDPISPMRDLAQPGGLPDFEGLPFFGATPHPTVLTPGTILTFDTLWTLAHPITSSLKIFIHITAPDGKIGAQWDGLDVNVGTLEAGDMFVQRHHIELPPDLPPGPYRISLGVYRLTNGARLKAQLGDRAVDSVVLGMLTVQ